MNYEPNLLALLRPKRVSYNKAPWPLTLVLARPSPLTCPPAPRLSTCQQCLHDWHIICTCGEDIVTEFRALTENGGG